jgi:hypothetical protein
MIAVNDVVLPSRNNGVYNSLAYLYKNMNSLIDICNGRHDAHLLDNTSKCQLLQVLEWFSQWKKLRDERVAIKEATEYNFVFQPRPGGASSH